MCLISSRKSPNKLKRDRRCWKLVYKSVEKDTFKPIYYDRKNEYQLNKTHFERSNTNVIPNYALTHKYGVGAGYVHAFTNLESALKLREQIALNTVEGLYNGIVPIICECVIPAGTRLYSNRMEHEICARRLRFDKILEP